MYRPPSRRSHVDKDLVLGLVVVVVVLVGVLGGAAWFFLKDSIGKENPSPDTDLRKAYATFYEQGNLVEGINQYKSLTERFPNEATVWRDYALASYFLGNVPAANLRVLLQKASQLNGHDALTQFFFTRTYLLDHNYIEAEKSAQAALKINSEHWLGHAAMAYSYIGVGDYTGTVKEVAVVEKGTGATPDDPFYNLILGDLQYSTLDCAFAPDHIEKALVKWPKLAVPRLLKAACLLYDPTATTTADRQDNQAKALELLLEAQRVQPDSTQVISTLAYYYGFFGKDGVSAEKYAQDYLKIYPGDPSILIVLGRVKSDKKEYDQSFKYFEECVRVNPKFYNCYSEWSWALLRQGYDLEDAGKEKEAAAVYTKSMEKALLLQPLIEQYPENEFMSSRGAYYYLLGQIQFYSGNYPAAIAFFEKALTSNPQAGYIYAFLGWAHWYNGEFDEAQDLYEKGLAIDHEDENIKQLGKDLKDAK